VSVPSLTTPPVPEDRTSLLPLGASPVTTSAEADLLSVLSPVAALLSSPIFEAASPVLPLPLAPPPLVSPAPMLAPGTSFTALSTFARPLLPQPKHSNPTPRMNGHLGQEFWIPIMYQASDIERILTCTTRWAQSEVAMMGSADELSISISNAIFESLRHNADVRPK
jgi:hypothetical protein